MSARKQITDQLETTLTGLATTGSTVFTSRVYDHEVVPSLAIYALNEETVDESMGTKQMRMLNVVIEARVKANTSVDDQLDQISTEVETAIFANDDTTLNGTCLDFDYQGLEVELNGEGEKPVGLMTMRFGALYRVDKTDVSAII